MNLAKMESLEREKEQWQQRAEESKEVIAQLTSTRGVNKIKEKVFAAAAYNVSSSPALSAASGRGGEEEGERTRMKKRIEELEAHLLDAKVREEQWKTAAVARTQSKELQDESIKSKEEGSTSNGIHTLLSEHDIAPLQLGEAVELEGQRQEEGVISTVQ
jgi:protein-arginine kinase activator protein McsA